MYLHQIDGLSVVCCRSCASSFSMKDVGIRGCHPRYHGHSLYLLSIELKVVNICLIILTRKAVGGARFMHCSRASLQASIPSVCGMLVYKELISSVSSIQSGVRGSILEIFSRKSLVSWIYDGICTTRGRR